MQESTDANAMLGRNTEVIAELALKLCIELVRAILVGAQLDKDCFAVNGDHAELSDPLGGCFGHWFDPSIVH
jgi:hypothetical protein